MEKPKTSDVTTFELPINWLGALFGAIGGATLGIAIWGGIAYFSESFYYVTPAVVGAFAGSGATKLGGRNHWRVGILATLVAIVAIIIGDFVESAAISKTMSMSLEELIRFMQLKIEDDIARGVLYIVGVVLAMVTGTMQRDQS